MWAEASGYGCIVIPRVIVKDGERVRRDFHFAKGKRIRMRASKPQETPLSPVSRRTVSTLQGGGDCE
jgi:hypothetical protein